MTPHLDKMAAAAKRGSTEDPEPEHKRLRRVTKDVAQIVLHVRAFFEEERTQKKRISISDVVHRVARATGLSERTVKSVSHAGVEAFAPSKEKETRERESVVPRQMLGQIRQTISTLYRDGHQVTLKTVIAALNAGHATRSHEGFKWSPTTLWRTLQRMGFRCSDESNHYTKLREKEAIQRDRTRFLIEVQEDRAAGKHIFYQDEVFFPLSTKPKKQWLDEQGKGGRDAPSGKGDRYCVAHVGSRECGLLPDAMLIFAVGTKKEKKRTMDSKEYLQWLENVVFRKLQEEYPNSVLVIDHASYHRIVTEDTKPKWRYMRKQQIIEWLLENGGTAEQLPPEMEMTVLELKELCSYVSPLREHEVVRLGQRFGIKVIFSPVAHPELNPIEKIWAYVKNIVEQRNGAVEFQDRAGFTMTELRKHIDYAFNKVTVELWRNTEDEVIKRENEYLEWADCDEYQMGAGPESESEYEEEYED